MRRMVVGQEKERKGWMRVEQRKRRTRKGAQKYYDGSFQITGNVHINNRPNP